MKNPFISVGKGGEQTPNLAFIIPLAIIIIGLLFFNPFYVVNATDRGLLLNWGAVSDTVVKPGLNFKIPIVQSVHTVSILPQTIKIDIPVAASGAITKDNQTIGAHVVAFYRYDESQLVTMYRNIGEEKSRNLIETGVQQALKTTIGGYTIFDIAANQNTIIEQALTTLKAEVDKYPFTITELRILNWDWSDDFDNQIKLTMTRAQEVKQKEQELLITTQVAQKQVVEAEAAKKATIANAEADFQAAKLHADARAQEGRGEKEYNQNIAATLEIKMQLMKLEIEMVRAKAWNGQQVPNNVYHPIPLDHTGGIKGN